MAKGHRSQIKRERNAKKDADEAQHCLTLAYLFRKHASY